MFRSLLAVLSLLVTAPSWFFAARNQQLATRSLIFAFRYLILISHTLPLAAQRFPYPLLVISWMLLTGNILLPVFFYFAVCWY